MAVADELAAQAAKDALAKEMEGKFNYIGDAYNQAQDAARANTENIINQLTQKATDYQTQFGKDSQSAYINKMQRGQQLEGELARLGLGNAGYGVTQRLMNDAAYGTNLANLQMALNQNLAGIDQAKATAGTDLGNTLADLASKYASQRAGIDQYITTQLQNAYNTAYDRSYKERQAEEDRKLAYAQLYARSSSGSGGKTTTNDDNFKLSKDAQKVYDNIVNARNAANTKKTGIGSGVINAAIGALPINSKDPNIANNALGDYLYSQVGKTINNKEAAYIFERLLS